MLKRSKPLLLLASLCLGPMPFDQVQAGDVPASQAASPRADRHALIVTISRYASSAMTPLPGANVDRESATEIATALQIPVENIRYLRDAEATGDNIRQAIRELGERAAAGAKVFIYFSGHGTRYFDRQFNECTEALAAYDGVWKGTVHHKEMADLLKPITGKADKLFVMYDACYSGGMLRSNAASRGLGGEPGLRARFSEIDPQCAKPSNVKSRAWRDGAGLLKGEGENFVLLSASRNDELSLEDEHKGGLATQFVRDCLLRDARDLDASGAVSLAEIQACAQAKVDKRMAGDRLYSAQHLTLAGNREFIPNWFAAPAAVPAPTSAAPALSGEQALRQIHAQRDVRRQLRVTLTSERLRIGRDALGLAVHSERPGYVYVLMAGSDNQSLTLLFPNTLDGRNRIEANQQLLLPRPAWAINAGGPVGRDHVLVMVSDQPRDLRGLAPATGSPFQVSLNDAQGRRQLGALLTQAAGVCHGRACSDAFAASLVSVSEIEGR